MKKIYLLLILVTTAISCQKDGIIEPVTNPNSQESKLELLSFNELPENIQKNFDEFNFIKIKDEKSSSLFGRINKHKKVKKIKIENNNTTYTFSLDTKWTKKTQNTPEGYYFDNLVIW